MRSAIKIIFSLITIVFCVTNAIAQQDGFNPKIKNESPLHVQSKDAAKQITDVIGSTYCNGVLDTCLNELKKIGISKARLNKRVQCTVGDFDGNGYLDFAIWGIDTTKEHQDNIDWSDAENYLVFFFEKQKVIRSIPIKTQPGFNLVHYPPRGKVGPNGEPVTKNDALWVCGETEGYDDTSKGMVYLFNADTGKFKTVRFGKK